MTKLKRAMIRAGVTREEAAERMKQQYPLLSATSLRAMLAPSASGAKATSEFYNDFCLKYGIPIQFENRKKKNRLYCRLTDEMWERFESVRKGLGFETRDEMVYRALLLYFAAYEEKAAGIAATMTTASEKTPDYSIGDENSYVKQEVRR